MGTGINEYLYYWSPTGQVALANVACSKTGPQYQTNGAFVSFTIFFFSHSKKLSVIVLEIFVIDEYLVNSNCTTV